MISKERIAELVNEFLENSNKFLVEVIMYSGNRILVFIDSDTSVTIEDCQALSRQIEKRLDRTNEDFDLTISSAGIDRPLKLHRQYVKNKGRKITVTTHSGTTIKGILVKTEESDIEIEPPVIKQKKGKEEQKRNTVISLNEIQSAIVEVDFKKVNG